MLYSLLTAVLILSFLMPIMCFLSFAKGYNINAEKNDTELIKSPKMPHIWHRKSEPTKDELALRAFNAAVEEFTGDLPNEAVNKEW